MSCTVTSQHQQIITTTINQLLCSDKIDTTVGECGYNIKGHFFPTDFDDLCEEVTKLAMKKIKDHLQNPHQVLSPQIEAAIEKNAITLIQKELKGKCTVVNPRTVRNPPPTSNLWKWFASWC